jgi:hypothetical protein
MVVQTAGQSWHTCCGQAKDRLGVSLYLAIMHVDGPKDLVLSWNIQPNDRVNARTYGDYRE